MPRDLSFLSEVRRRPFAYRVGVRFRGRYRPTALPRAGDVPVAVASFARPWGPVVLNPADSPRIPEKTLGKAQIVFAFTEMGPLIKANHGPYTNPNG